VSEQDLKRAVVVQPRSAPVRVSPFDSATSENSLSEGDEVAVLGQHGDFVQVRDGRGQSGWIESNMVQAIFPRTS
jgi:SH3-like domain-containing protein